MSAQTFLNDRVALHGGDCLAILKTLPDASVDSVVTDPPYHLTSIVKRFGGKNAAPAKAKQTGAFARSSRGFMGKTWDGGDIAFRVELWSEVLRVLKPGGHLAAFSGTRTYHRMAVAIEDAGFEIRDQTMDIHRVDSERDAFLASLNPEQLAQFVKLFGECDELGQLAWTYGSGFPKSHDVSKAIDKAAGVARPVVGPDPWSRKPNVQFGAAKAAQLSGGDLGAHPGITAPATDFARHWQGWGSALKPAWEPICLARKPLDGTIAENVLAHGVGALNIDGCRVETNENLNGGAYSGSAVARAGAWQNDDRSGGGGSGFENGGAGGFVQPKGRFPANLIHDGSPEVLAAFPEAGGGAAGGQSGKSSIGGQNVYGGRWNDGEGRAARGTSDKGGSAARFFYTAKADADDRIGSKHPTVKPVDLMQWLVRLVTPKGGTVLDLFAGTGTTGEAAFREGCRAILIEREEEYRADISRRMDLVLAGPDERKRRIAAMKAPADLTGTMFAEAAE